MLPRGRLSEVSSPRELYIRISLIDHDSMPMTLSVRLSRLRIPASILFRKGANFPQSALFQSSSTG